MVVLSIKLSHKSFEKVKLQKNLNRYVTLLKLT